MSIRSASKGAGALYEFLDLYRFMLTARCVDAEERRLVARGDAFFHVSGAGHEATAALARHLTPEDYLHCHYRDKALMLARGIPVVEFFNSLLCNNAGASAGRQMSAHLCDRSRRILSVVGPVGNSALQAVGIAAEVQYRKEHAMVLCSVGDGTTQEGEFLEAVAEAVRRKLPVMFLIQDNGLSISTRTRGRTFFSLPDEDAKEFYGLPIQKINGRDAVACDEAFATLASKIRQSGRPSLVVMDLERLGDHTNADDERVYRSPDEIQLAKTTSDPIQILRSRLIHAGVSERDLLEIEQAARREVTAAAEEALLQPPPAVVTSAKAELPSPLKSAAEVGGSGPPALTMAEAIRETLRIRMSVDRSVTLYGEDIEDPKGDVFGLTRGLSGEFGERVLNSPLSESTIIGTSIGRALAGGHPVAFIQFADFLPLAFNQIATELGSMHWRTNGQWQCPVVVMVACGAYRPGLGPFHAHTFESLIAHIPGIDLVMPSNATDAAGALNAAFESRRPTFFFYPKTCLNDRERMTSSAVSRHLVPVGQSRLLRSGQDVTFVSWGSTVKLCERAAMTLEKNGVTADVIDLRWLSPWDEEAVYRSAKKTGRLVVVHEDNRTAGFGAEVIAAVAERGTPILARRVTRPDTYVPCNFGNQLTVLPTFKSVLSAAAELLGLELSWPPAIEASQGKVLVQSIGSSPADETVKIVELFVQRGQPVAAGDPIASLECDKAVFELSAPVSGIVSDLFVDLHQTVQVGSSLLSIESTSPQERSRQRLREDVGEPTLKRRQATPQRLPPKLRQSSEIGLSSIYTAKGSDRVTNLDLAERFPDKTANEIRWLTGIEQRPRVSSLETALTMGVEAAARALDREKVALADIDLIVCSTSTPVQTAPSLACLILAELSNRYGQVEIPAFDMSAACTGYLYALEIAWNFLQSNGAGKVLVITSEEMSSIVNPRDFATAILFADAATATIVSGGDHIGRSAKARLHRPLLSARGDDGNALRVPSRASGHFVQMDGKKIFSEAVRRMTGVLNKACERQGYSVADLDLIVPHQANARIIEAIRSRLKLRPEMICNDMLRHGNTSSSSIPLALEGLLKTPLTQRIGLCALGAGFTFGSAIIEQI
jgi:2-oxoisovalerate dehydrogenase E1 component